MSLLIIPRCRVAGVIVAIVAGLRVGHVVVVVAVGHARLGWEQGESSRFFWGRERQ